MRSRAKGAFVQIAHAKEEEKVNPFSLRTSPGKKTEVGKVAL